MEETRSSPPLNAIRVFVEAARQLNFSQAGRALGMTQGGVSRHIAVLEKHLGQAVFVRSGAAVALSDAGRLYFDTVREAMSTIELATLQMACREPDAGRLIVRTSLPTFAMTTIIPALPHFRPRRPVSVGLMTALSPPSQDEAYDVLITRDLVIPDAEHWLLAQEALVCVASKERCREYAHLPLSRWRFLVAQSRPGALVNWAHQCGLAAHEVQVAARFDHYLFAIPAAIGGMGHLVVPRILVAEALRQGQLALAWPAAVRQPDCYVGYVNPRSQAPESARLFCRWLKGWLREAEAASTSPA